MRPIAPLVTAAALALLAAWVPLGTVVACSCAFVGYPEAVAQADIAFVGTVIGEAEPGNPGGLDTARYAFDVDRATTPLESPLEIDALFGNGANCGVDMAIGEEWLVIATIEGGRPTTNLCTGSTLTISMDAETRELLGTAMEPVEGGPANVADDRSASLPLVIAMGAVLIIGGVSVVAFRRERR
jgi:hypothetical protein